MKIAQELAEKEGETHRIEITSLCNKVDELERQVRSKEAINKGLMKLKEETEWKLLTVSSSINVE